MASSVVIALSLTDTNLGEAEREREREREEVGKRRSAALISLLKNQPRPQPRNKQKKNSLSPPVYPRPRTRHAPLHRLHRLFARRERESRRGFFVVGTGEGGEGERERGRQRSLFFLLSTFPLSHPLPPKKIKQRPLVSVVRRTSAASNAAEPSASSSLSAGDVVLCRVSRISQRAAFATIVCVERRNSSSPPSSSAETATTTTAVPLATPLTGILRAADLRASEIDAVEVPACFRPGDVVRARVLSLGDARSFYLSTAADDLGVVFARSEAAPGVPLVAESDKHMRCPSTGAVEKRKVARQQQQQ